MRRAKEISRGDFQFYASEMSAKARQRAAMKLALRHVLQRNAFTMQYQPLVLMTAETAIGMEALIRWRNTLLGNVSPADFIPLAEEIGLIISIGEWVLRTACAQNRAWQHHGLPAVTVAVNVSALQLRDPGFADFVIRVLDQTDLDAHCLGLEITENMLTGKPTT
jgi:EAL domain-containing protein (putative c-di-GMP-specific phosphodiesterase class I)